MKELLKEFKDSMSPDFAAAMIVIGIAIIAGLIWGL